MKERTKTNKLVGIFDDSFSKLKDEALNGPKKEVYRGEYTPLLNDIIDAHYARKAKRKAKK